MATRSFTALAAALVAAALGAAGSASGFDVNLAPDPSFEAPGVPSYSSNGSCTFSQATDAARLGSHSLKIASSQPAGTLCRWMSVVSAIRVGPGGAATVDVWDKTQGAAAHADALTVTFWNSSQTYISGSASEVTGAGGTHDWQQLGLSVTAPAGATFMRVEFRLYGSGTAWFDDVAVESEVRAIHNTGLPLITTTGFPSQFVVGAQLTTTVGGWTDTPEAFDVTWLRCDGSGANCLPILGAGGPPR